MSRKSLPAAGLRGWKRIAIATTLLVVPIMLAAFWLLGDFSGYRKATIVRRALAENRFEQAFQVLDGWLRASPYSAEAHFLKARLAIIQNDFPTVEQELARAQRLGYGSQAVARLRGLLLARSNRLSEAEPLLREAIESSPRLDVEVAEALCRLYLGSFRLGEAALVLDRWMREVPDDARPYLLQTEIDTRLGAKPDVIIARYRAALARDPELDQARLGLATQLARNFRFAEAASEYTAYLVRQPGDLLGYLGAGQNAVEMGQYPEAARLLDHALTLAPHDSEVLAARASLEMRQDHHEAALRYFDQAVTADPFDYQNRYQRMLILARLGRTSEASAERGALERLADEQKQFGQVSRDLRRNPRDPQLRSQAARWLMEHGHEEEAVEWANLVLSSQPAHPAMNRLLADYYRKKGQLGLANFHEAHAARSTDQHAVLPQQSKPN
jgi:tetratricopeptide (TPR) repeat protein